jgi:DNA-binding transcriptional LysR family regulator
MDIHQLGVFASVFRNRSFSKASEELRLTQPTVSEHVRTLEEELGTSLFDRSGRSIHPTPEAEILFARASDILERVGEIRSALSAHRNVLAGQVLIGASSIPGTYILPQAIAAFRSQHPAVSFEVRVADSREIAAAVAAHELLLGVVGSKTALGHLQYRPLMEDDLIVIDRPGAWDGPMTLQRLAKRPVVVREEGSGTRQEAERILLAAGVAPEKLQVAAILGSTEAVKHGVQAGLGWSVVSRRAVEAELSAGGLREVPLRGVRMRRSFHLVTHGRRTLPAPTTRSSSTSPPRQTEPNPASRRATPPAANHRDLLCSLLEGNASWQSDRGSCVRAGGLRDSGRGSYIRHVAERPRASDREGGAEVRGRHCIGRLQSGEHRGAEEVDQREEVDDRHLRAPR